MLVTAPLSPAQLDGLRRWRDEHAPEASLAAVTRSATLRAMAHHGAAGVFVMMDCRRYLAASISTSCRGHPPGGPGSRRT